MNTTAPIQNDDFTRDPEYQLFRTYKAWDVRNMHLACRVHLDMCICSGLDEPLDLDSLFKSYDNHLALSNELFEYQKNINFSEPLTSQQEIDILNIASKHYVTVDSAQEFVNVFREIPNNFNLIKNLINHKSLINISEDVRQQYTYAMQLPRMVLDAWKSLETHKDIKDNPKITPAKLRGMTFQLMERYLTGLTQLPSSLQKRSIIYMSMLLDDPNIKLASAPYLSPEIDKDINIPKRMLTDAIEHIRESGLTEYNVLLNTLRSLNTNPITLDFKWGSLNTEDEKDMLNQEYLRKYEVSKQAKAQNYQEPESPQLN